MIRYLILATALFAAGNAHGAVLKESATIDRDQVMVGDLFDDVGDKAMQPVGTAPAPGQKNVYDVSALQRVAHAYGIDWRPATLETRVTLTRASTKVTTSQIQQAVMESLGHEASADKLDVQLDRRTMELNLPASAVLGSIRLVDSKYDARSYRFNGTLIVELGEGADPVVTPITGRAVPQYDVPVVNKRIDTGSTIADSDLEYVTVAADRMQNDLIRNMKDLVGKETRRPLMQGSTIMGRDLRPAMLVKRGNAVTMVVNKNGLFITAKGRALGDGAQGDNVKVMNVQSNKIVDGVVSGNGDVVIDANS